MITADSLRLDGQLRADLARVSQATQSCLAIGPDALTLDGTPPLMGLTAPKPILLLVGKPGHQRVLRWSFRYHGFVRTGIDPKTVACPAS